MPSGWNIADAFEVIADQLPGAPALWHAGRMTTWQKMDRRADGVAATLLDGGARRQDTVAQYLHTAPEYLESFLATT